MKYLDQVWKIEEDVMFDHHTGQVPSNILVRVSDKSTVLISCPHSVKHLRNGAVKSADVNTYGLGVLLNRMFDVSLITLTGFDGTDPNHDADCLYKCIFKSIVTTLDLTCVVDLHGCKTSESYDCVLADDYTGTTLADGYLADSWLSLGYLRTAHNDPFHAKPNTIAQYSAYKLGVPAIELELTPEVRCGAKLDLFIKQFQTWLRLVSKCN